MFKRNAKSGFSIAELLVVVFIISVIATITLVNYQESRKQVRDELRISHMEQLSVAMRLYAEKYGNWPDCEEGLRIDEGGSVDWHSLDADDGSVSNIEGCVDRQKIIDFLKENFEFVPMDPLGPGNLDYYYYYDSLHICNTSIGTTPVVFAVNMEVAASNKDAVCDDPGGNDGGYLNTLQFGGSFDPSRPYVVKMSRE